MLITPGWLYNEATEDATSKEPSFFITKKNTKHTTAKNANLAEHQKSPRTAGSRRCPPVSEDIDRFMTSPTIRNQQLSEAALSFIPPFTFIHKVTMDVWKTLKTVHQMC